MMSTKPSIRLNVLANDVANAVQITKATNGLAYIGIMVKNYADVESAVSVVEEYRQAGVAVSVGLGAGDPSQWRKVALVAARTKAPHVNQVLPAAGYTLGLLEGAGCKDVIVNALISPGGTPGKVNIFTGPHSQPQQELVSCEAAAALLQDIGIKSVKFYPINGDQRLDELAAMVKAAVKCGITVFEPTGGIDARTVHRVVTTCLENGAQLVIPHIYTAFVDKATGQTSADAAARLIESLARLADG